MSELKPQLQRLIAKNFFATNKNGNRKPMTVWKFAHTVPGPKGEYFNHHRLYEWINGDRPIPRRLEHWFCDLFGCSLDEFWGR